MSGLATSAELLSLITVLLVDGEICARVYMIERECSYMSGVLCQRCNVYMCFGTSVLLNLLMLYVKPMFATSDGSSSLLYPGIKQFLKNNF